MVRNIHRIRSLRRIALPLLKALAFNLRISNPHVPGARVYLNSFRHKGYWFHGRDRERDTMERFRQVICPGQTVIEVGGHIGYITQLFSSLVGPDGQVFVFEPGSNNLPYIRRNIAGLGNTRLIEKGASDTTGTAQFFEESLTGQNNSLDRDYEHRELNERRAFVQSEIHAREIETTTLDDFCAGDVRPDFIKIDVEGFELNVLRGMTATLAIRPCMMIEITKHHEDVHALLAANDYVVLDDRGQAVEPSRDGNAFCYPKERLSQYT